ncbi:hypothetical protein D3C72_862350 [compost metagenome]
MRPPSALPFTWARSMPFSSAILRANGDAFTRPLASAVEASATGADVAEAAVDPALASSLAGAAAGAACNNGLTSVPGLPTIAIISFTLAALPSSTPMYNKVPSA